MGYLGVPITLSILGPEAGLAAGLVVGLIGLPVPGVVADTIGLFGQVAVPLAMFAVGLTLPSAARGIMQRAVPIGTLVFGTVVKVVVLPAATVAGLALAGASLGPTWTGAAIIMASMPTSATAFVMSQQSDPDPRIVSAMIAASCVVAVITIPVMVTLFVG